MMEKEKGKEGGVTRRKIKHGRRIKRVGKVEEKEAGPDCCTQQQ